jgi:putative PIN family toxin of toxin-antitoxin system
VISVPAFFEYEEVLRLPKLFSHLTAQDIDDFLDFMASLCEPVKINFIWRPQLPDPDDDLFLEFAVSAQAQAIVTYNLSHFVGVERFCIRAISPKQLIKEMSL